MRTRHLLIGGFFACALATSCTSFKDACKNAVDQTCDRVFECQSTEVKATPQFIATYGTSVSDCKTKLYANPLAPSGGQGIACDNVTTEQQSCVNLSRPNATKLSSSKSTECYEKREDLSCSDFLIQVEDPAQAPNACIERCS